MHPLAPPDPPPDEDVHPLAPPDPPLDDGVIRLRPPRASDRDEVVAALQDPEVSRWTTVPWPYGPADFDAWLQRARDDLRRGRALSLVIEDREGRVAGSAGLHEIDSGRPDIGYWVARDHRGRGYAARAVDLLRRRASELGFDRVDLQIHPDNAASLAVARAAGFAATGESAPCRRNPDGALHLRLTWPPP